jgi:hypothetical protein
MKLMVLLPSEVFMEEEVEKSDCGSPQRIVLPASPAC